MRALQKRNMERGSLELVALGFCAALVVLLAIPLVESLLETDPAVASSQSSTISHTVQFSSAPTK